MNLWELVQKSQNIVLDLRSYREERELQSALTLFGALAQLGKNVIPAGLIQEQFPQPNKTLSSLEKTFVISLKGLAPYITRVTYEKNTSDLELFFTLRDTKNISPVSSQSQRSPDLTIIVGDERTPHNGESAEEDRMKKFEGEVERFLGFFPKEEQSLLKLFGKVMARCRSYTTQGLSLSVARKTDFQETNTCPKMLPKLLQYTAQFFGDQISCFIFFETQTGMTRGIGLNIPSHAVEWLGSLGEIQQVKNWLILGQSNISFERIQEKISSLQKYE